MRESGRMRRVGGQGWIEEGQGRDKEGRGRDKGGWEYRGRRMREDEGGELKDRIEELRLG